MIQRTIQEVKFQDIILSKKQRQARKTNKLRFWLQYLNMLDENKNFQKKNQVIIEIHKNFILREQFWLREINRVLNSERKLNEKSFEFALLSIQDGFYMKVAKFISQKLFEAYIQQCVRKNYVISKLQLLIEQFSHEKAQGFILFEILLEIYIKLKDNKKIRQTYKRQLQMGFDNYDVTYIKYAQWQQEQQVSTSKSSKQVLQKILQNSRMTWEQTQIFIQQQMPRICSQTQIIQQREEKMLRSNKKHLKRCLIYLQEMNVAKIDEEKYMKLLSILSNQKQKLWYLRRMALSESHDMVDKYLQTLQLANSEQQQIINSYKLALSWQNGLKHQKSYLYYLIRRINKHLICDQLQEYNNTWGANVEFFRNQISQLISKERTISSLQKQIRQQYYFLWIEVEAALIRDSKTIQEIFDNLLAWDKHIQIYVQYAKFMIRLNQFAKARFIYSKTCQTYSYNDLIVNQYMKFLKIYGTLEQINKLKQKISLKPKETILKEISKNHIDKQKLQNSRKLQNSQKLGESLSNNYISLSSSQKPSSHSDTVQNYLTENLQFFIQMNPKDQIQPLKQIVKISQKEEKNQFKRISPVQVQQQKNTQKKKVHLDKQNTLFSKDIKNDWGQADIMIHLIHKKHVSEIRIVQKQNGRICYIDFESEQIAKQQLNQNKSILHLTQSQPIPKKQNCTFFLSNLPTKIIKQQIIDLIPSKFRDQIVEIRFKQKNYKKTAFLQMISQQARNQCVSQLKSQKIQLEGRSIIAMICQNDKQKDKRSKTIFLKNLSFKCREKDIQNYFSQKGCLGIVQVYIPKDERTKKSKGYAYVQFENSSEAQLAVQMQRGELYQRQFSINRSDRSITQHTTTPQRQANGEKSEKKSQKFQNKKSNSFFSNIFSK